MKVEIKPSDLSGKVSAIASKSDAHRAIICAGLADKKTSIYIKETSEDIEATLNCIKAMGANVLREDKNFIIEPVYEPMENYMADCGESGSTLRFLLPVAAALGKTASFRGRGRLPKRPMSPIIHLLKEKGIEFSEEVLPFTLNGRLNAGEFKIDGNVSSQFISGLMFALPLLDGDSTIELLSPLQSKAYVDMTEGVLEKFGAKIQKSENGYKIPSVKRYSSPLKYEVEGDWSNSAFFLVAAALDGEIEMTGLDLNSKQSDKTILDILKISGADFEVNDNSICVKKSRLKAFELDVSECPDLFPVTAVLACGACGKTTLYNASRLRIKESDRITTTKELILGLGGKALETEDSLIIYGNGKLSGGSVNSYNDHRIAMSAFTASCICENKVVLDGAEAMRKSYPDFLRDFESLGGKANVI